VDGIFAPAGTPRPVIQTLHRELVKAYKRPGREEPGARDRLGSPPPTPRKSSPLSCAPSRAKWSKVISEAEHQGGVKIESEGSTHARANSSNEFEAPGEVGEQRAAVFP